MLAMVELVPILGAIFGLGYRMILMRDIAWGVERGLPRFGEADQIVGRGFSGYLVSIVWGLILVPFAIVGVIVLLTAQFRVIAAGGVPSTPATSWWFVLLIGLMGIGVNVFAAVAVLRVAIYTKASAGLSLSAVLDLISRCQSGFVRVTGMMAGVAVLSLALSMPAQLAQQYAHPSFAVVLALTYGGGLVIRVLMTPLSLMVACAYGLWARETDPSTWPPLASRSARAGVASASHVEQAYRADGQTVD